MGFTSKIVLMLIAVLLLITPPVSSSDNAHRPNDDHVNDEIRIVLIGRTGSGKSSTGNTILGHAFFNSEIGSESVTKKSKRGVATRFGRRVHVVDTPGLFDTGMTHVNVMKEITKIIAITSPGPHAFVLVSRVDRFTQKEQETVEHFRKLFGKEMNKYLFVLFTRKDNLNHGGVDIHKFVKSVPKSLQQLIEDCDRRYIGFNNRLNVPERDDQVQELLDLIDANIRNNDGKYYTNQMYKEAEKVMLRKEGELVEQLRKENKEIANVYVNKIPDGGERCKSGAEIGKLKQQLYAMRKKMKRSGSIGISQENEDQTKRKGKLERKELEIARESARAKAEDEDSSILQDIYDSIKYWLPLLLFYLVKLFLGF